jgi:hypothetical protein
MDDLVSNYKYAGFHRVWQFVYENSVDDEVFLGGLRLALDILRRRELLIPTYMTGQRMYDFVGLETEAVIDAIRSVLLSGKDDVIVTLGGYGMVYHPEGGHTLVRDLVSIYTIILSAREFSFSTECHVWVPLSVDQTNEYSWQIDEAELNASRLEMALAEFRDAFGLDGSPKDSDEDRDEPIWIKGLKLYVSPGLLLRELKRNPPSQNLDLKRHLIAENDSSID